MPSSHSTSRVNGLWRSGSAGEHLGAVYHLKAASFKPPCDGGCPCGAALAAAWALSTFSVASAPAGTPATLALPLLLQQPGSSS